MPGVSGGPGRDRGAAVLEYIGAVLVAALVVGIVAAAMLGVADDVRRGTTHAICSIIQRDGCGAGVGTSAGVAPAISAGLTLSAAAEAAAAAGVGTPPG